MTLAQQVQAIKMRLDDTARPDNAKHVPGVTSIKGKTKHTCSCGGSAPWGEPPAAVLHRRLNGTRL